MKNGIYLICLLFVVGFTQAQLATTQNLITSWKNDTDLQNASWAFCIIDNNSGNVLVDVDATRSLIPASSTKVITTATALALLGENFHYTTSVYYNGTIIDSVLNGNIIIKGSGDPTLCSSKMQDGLSKELFLSEIISALRSKGIRKINGHIHVDASCYNDLSIPRNWNWSDIGNHFGCGAFGVNFSDNEFSVLCNPTKEGLAPNVELLEAIPGLRYDNRFYCTATVSDGDEAYIFGAPYSMQRFFWGPVPLGSSIRVKGSMPDPPMYLAQWLTENIAKQGIESTHYPSTDRSPIEEQPDNVNEVVLLTHFHSQKLSEIVKATNQRSLNLYAESLLKTLAINAQLQGNTENGLKILYTYWKSKGLNTSGFYMKDGSGLSRHNAISPYHFASILYLVSKEKYYTSFYNSLAVAGESGTLKNLCAGTSASGRIIGKSGTVERGISYTGYVNSSSGKKLSFSIIVNNHNCTNAELRKKIEQLMIAMSKI